MHDSRDELINFNFIFVSPLPQVSSCQEYMIRLSIGGVDEASGAGLGSDLDALIHDNYGNFCFE